MKVYDMNIASRYGMCQQQSEVLIITESCPSSERNRLVHLSSKQKNAVLNKCNLHQRLCHHSVNMYQHKKTLQVTEMPNTGSHETQYNHSTIFSLVSAHSIWSGDVSNILLTHDLHLPAKSNRLILEVTENATQTL